MSKSITTYLSHNLEARPANDPVVIFLHGYGADEADLPDLISHLPKVSWVSPRAPLSSGNGGFEWYLISPADYTPQQDIERATLKLWDWIDQTLPANTPLIPIGFSQGALMATQLLRTRPQRIQKTVLMAGFILKEEQEADRNLKALNPKVLYCHGDADNRIAPEMVQDIQTWLEANTNVTDKLYSGLGHSVDNRVIKDVSEFLTR
jgi:phospholipase/carboxylesterase